MFIIEHFSNKGCMLLDFSQMNKMLNNFQIYHSGERGLLSGYCVFTSLFTLNTLYARFCIWYLWELKNTWLASLIYRRHKTTQSSQILTVLFLLKSIIYTSLVTHGWFSSILSCWRESLRIQNHGLRRCYL